jgi:hypothetical protein
MTLAKATNRTFVTQTNLLSGGPTNTLQKMVMYWWALANTKFVWVTNFILVASGRRYQGGCNQYNPFGKN